MIKSSNNGPFTIPTAPSAGTTVAQSGSANTFGSYVQLTASTSEPDYIVGVRVSSGAITGTTFSSMPTYVSVQLGTGVSLSETTVGQVDMPIATYGILNTAIIVGAKADVPFPIPVANATRIAAKTASDFASAINWKVSLQCYKQGDLIDAGVIEQADVQTIKTQAVTCSAGVTVGAFVGNATAALGVDGSGRVDLGKALGTAVTLDANSVLNVSAKYLAGTALTGRDIGASVVVGTNNDKTGYSLSVAPPTAGQIATAVWQDATAGDFAVAHSIGKTLYIDNVVPGSAGGLAIFDAVYGLVPANVNRWLNFGVGISNGLPSVSCDKLSGGGVNIGSDGNLQVCLSSINDAIGGATPTSVAAGVGSIAFKHGTLPIVSDLPTAAPTTAQIAAAILKTPANLLATDAAGDVTTNNPPITLTGSLPITPMQIIRSGGPIQTKNLYAKLHATMAPLVFKAVGINGAAGVFVGPVKFRLYVIGSGTPGNETVHADVIAQLNADKTQATVQVLSSANDAIITYGWTLWDTGLSDQPLSEGQYIISDAGPAP